MKKNENHANFIWMITFREAYLKIYMNFIIYFKCIEIDTLI